MAATTPRKPQGSVRRVRSAERQGVPAPADREVAREVVERLAALVAADAADADAAAVADVADVADGRA